MIKNYRDTRLPFHIVDGAHGVSLLIRKNTATWLFRLVRFGEVSRYVHDSRGRVVIYSHIAMLENVIARKAKIHARYSDGFKGLTEWEPEKYNLAWADKLHNGDGSECKTDLEMIKDPYCSWVAGYKAHFILERQFSKRKHYAYYKPI